mmetsp:Transcript_4894/g.31336  ORF Transcript_4894/g.31336 Transcript_4894/m.31336 type:complete len:226 (+) Transcript_4894:2372-3049(+)
MQIDSTKERWQGNGRRRDGEERKTIVHGSVRPSDATCTAPNNKGERIVHRCTVEDGGKKQAGRTRYRPTILLLGRRLFFRFLLLRHAVTAANHRMVALVRFQRDLLHGLETVLLKLLHFTCKDRLGGCGGINAVGLDADHELTLVLQEILCVQGHDTSLVWLCNICENCVHHSDQHAVLLRVTRILDDGDDVRPLLGHVDQVPSRTMRELHRIDHSGRSHHVRHV